MKYNTSNKIYLSKITDFKNLKKNTSPHKNYSITVIRVKVIRYFPPLPASIKNNQTQRLADEHRGAVSSRADMFL